MAALIPSSNTDEAEWNHHKDLIISLYLGASQGERDRAREHDGLAGGQTLDELVASMKTYGFVATAAQFETRLNSWGARKNLKPEEWEQVHKRLDRLPQTMRSRVLISGRVAAGSKIKRARRYYKQKSRLASNTSAAHGSSTLSALPGQVHIEVQEPDGRWAQLSDETALTTMGFHDPRAAIPSRIPTRPSSPNLSISYIPSPFNVGVSVSASPPRTPQAYRLGIPSAWLDGLPSRAIINATREYRLIGSASVSNATQTRGEPNKPISIPKMGLQVSNLIAMAYYFFSRHRQDLTPPNISMSELCRYFVLDNMNEMENEVLEEVVDFCCFDSTNSESSLLLRGFIDAPFLPEALASGFLKASMDRRRYDIISGLLEKGLIHVNDTIVHVDNLTNERYRLTLLEAAADRGNGELIILLLSHGADPNKTYDYNSRGRHGALDYYLNVDSPLSFSNIVLRELLDAGAELRPSIAQYLRQVDVTTAPHILLRINPSQHETYFEKHFWEHISGFGEDIHAASLINQLVSDCVERHGSRCVLQYQRDVDFALVVSAGIGRTKTLLAILPHASHGSVSLDEDLLSASIRSNKSEILDKVMLRRPNINASLHGPYSTPLAESIRCKHVKFIDCFANAGIFESLHKDFRLESALVAAVEIDDTKLITRLLDSCPDLESQRIRDPLEVAIVDDHEMGALVLLKFGASLISKICCVRSEQYYLRRLALRYGTKEIVRLLLEIGETNHEQDPGGIAWELSILRDSDIARNYLSSFHCDIRYRIAGQTKISEFDPEEKESVIALYLAPALQDRTLCDLILTSKLATAELLTACLATAVSRNNLTLAQRLIESGANPSDETVLNCAMRWGPDLFPFLNSVHQHRPVVTRGLRTKVLKRAIEEGPARATFIAQMVESGLVDIFDTGNGDEWEDILTPLGVAIKQASDESLCAFSYEVVKLLLRHKCDPNSIVKFHGGRGIQFNETAILEAIDTGNRNLVKLLIDHGAHVNTELRHLVRRTPLQKAAEKGDLGMVRLLLQHGAEVNAKPAKALGGTALQLAAISGNCDVACELLEYGASLYTSPPRIGGRWPIEGAAEWGRFEMIQFLWKANQETYCASFDDNGFRKKNFEKAMRLARAGGYRACVKLIADLASLPVTATDVPPVVSPMYVDWPLPEE
ncbi:ankyrin [Xylaria palmicola]|nr:ankyrin [Xylaria palmicola]